MPPNARAQKIHDEMFPGHVSKLAVSDPDLIETFDNFAFDEVLRHGSLDTRTRLMVRLADELLARDGRMVEAIDTIGRGAEAREGEPYELPLKWPIG